MTELNKQISDYMKEMAKKSVKSRFFGLSPAQISKKMGKVRRGKGKKRGKKLCTVLNLQRRTA
jgi:hypothetical protein